MKVDVNKDACVGCGMCVGMAGDVFEMQDGASVVKEGADLEANKDAINQAASACPVNAIEVQE